MVRGSPLMSELDLATHGLEYIGVDPGGVALGWDAPGPAPIFADVDQTLDALAVHFPHEVANYRRYAKAAVPVAKLLRDLANADPTGPALLRTALAKHSPAALRLLRWSRMTVAEVLRGFFTTKGCSGRRWRPGQRLGCLTTLPYRASARSPWRLTFKPVGVARRERAFHRARAAAITTLVGPAHVHPCRRDLSGHRVRGVELRATRKVGAAPLVVVAATRAKRWRYLRDAKARQRVHAAMDDTPHRRVRSRRTRLPQSVGKRRPTARRDRINDQHSAPRSRPYLGR